MILIFYVSLTAAKALSDLISMTAAGFIFLNISQRQWALAWNKSRYLDEVPVDLELFTFESVLVVKHRSPKATWPNLAGVDAVQPCFKDRTTYGNLSGRRTEVHPANFGLPD